MERTRRSEVTGVDDLLKEVDEDAGIGGKGDF